MTTVDAVPELSEDPPEQISIKIIVTRNAESSSPEDFLISAKYDGIADNPSGDAVVIEVLEKFLATLKEPKQEPKK